MKLFTDYTIISHILQDYRHIKSPSFAEAFYMVQRVGESLHHIRDELVRWRKVLEIPYREHLLSR